MIFAVPASTPVTIPELLPTVAMPVLPLVHVPPDGEELNVVVAPTHTVAVPVIADGVAFTVTTAVTLQVVGSVYVIDAVPALAPETTPDEEPTVATPVAPLVHVPPDGVEPSVVVAPTHRFSVPVIDDGRLLTVMFFVAKHPPARL